MEYVVSSNDTLVAEQVDAQDLKSCSPKGEYGFDSRLGYNLKEESGETLKFFRSLFLSNWNLIWSSGVLITVFLSLWHFIR